MLAGGADIDPASYGAEPDPHTKGARRERDRFELALCHGALERGLPLLGVCRGMQLLNVACGGTLEQHLARRRAAPAHAGPLLRPRRPARTRLAAPREPSARERVSVRSHHHQGVGRLGEGLTASGWAEPGETIEAIETTGDAWALGILWHAEEERRSPVLAALVEARVVASRSGGSAA